MKTIDVSRDHCPMTFVKVKVALEELALGEQLDVLLCAGEALENVPKSIEEAGNRIVEIREEKGRYRVIIEKHMAEHTAVTGRTYYD
jgi:tRNA 2-thiouridine synthesizing protein A